MEMAARQEDVRGIIIIFRAGVGKDGRAAIQTSRHIMGETQEWGSGACATLE